MKRLEITAITAFDAAVIQSALGVYYVQRAKARDRAMKRAERTGKHIPGDVAGIAMEMGEIVELAKKLQTMFPEARSHFRAHAPEANTADKAVQP